MGGLGILRRYVVFNEKAMQEAQARFSKKVQARSKCSLNSN